MDGGDVFFRRLSAPHPSAPPRLTAISGPRRGTHDIAERAIERLVPTVILHVGDYDPSGVSIFESMVDDASAFVEAERVTANISLRGVRVALTDW